MKNTALVDTGFLIALFDRKDPLHESAKEALASLAQYRRTNLVSVWPTVVEACFFLNARGKTALLEWIRRGAMRLRAIEIGDVPAVISVLQRFSDQDIDLADATLVWLAEAENATRVLTTDRRDFAFLRTKDGGAFERIWVDP